MALINNKGQAPDPKNENLKQKFKELAKNRGLAHFVYEDGKLKCAVIETSHDYIDSSVQ